MKKILVIDDDALVRTSVVTVLRRQGYDVLSAVNGNEGLDLAITHLPDLVLSDINLPEHTGLEILKELRSRTETAALPVILMTGEAQKVDARSSMNLGADDYLQKPFNLEQMLETIKARLARQAGITRAFEAHNEAERLNAAEKIRLQTMALEAAANGIMITDPQGTILWVNPAFTELTGYTSEEVLGQNPRILNSGRHPRSFFATIWAAILDGKVWHGEVVNKRKDGTFYDEEMTITPVRGENGEVRNYIAIKQNVSRRKEIEQALVYKRDLLQALMDNLPDYIYFKDSNSRFTQINHALARHLGLRNPEEAVGKSDADFFPVRQARQKMVDERRLLATGEVILNLVEKADTSVGERWVSSTKVPTYGPDGRIAGLVGISRDITASKQAEDELQRKSALLEAQVNSSIDGILVVDEQGKKTLQNHRFTELFSLPASIVDDSDDSKSLNWMVGTMEDPEEFLKKVKHLYAHPDLISRDELKLKTAAILDRYSTPLRGKNGTYFGRMWTFRDITERKRMEETLRESEQKFYQLANNIKDVFWIASPDLHKIHYISPGYELIWGRTVESLYVHPQDWMEAVAPEDRERVNAIFSRLMHGEPEVSAEYRVIRPDGSTRWVHDRGFQVRDGDGIIMRLAGFASDITRRKQLETELFHARKLESIGQLSAGIAHEINTPTQYVGDNTRFCRDSFAAVGHVLEAYQQLLAATKAGTVTPELVTNVEEVLAASDLDYLSHQIPQALNETLEGVERVTKIVRAMKDFAHPGDKTKTSADLNKAIESTITVARNEWKYVSDLQLELDPTLPFVPCFLGEINQVILNLVINAAHAIEDVVKKNPGVKGLITVQTRRDLNHAEVRVTDTGTGIPEALRSKIFEPFFTTKEVGRGTGQGLAMVYGCIVNRHGGTITFETEVGRGTAFIIRLPVKTRPDTSSPPRIQEPAHA